MQACAKKTNKQKNKKTKKQKKFFSFSPKARLFVSLSAAHHYLGVNTVISLLASYLQVLCAHMFLFLCLCIHVYITICIII